MESSVYLLIAFLFGVIVWMLFLVWKGKRDRNWETQDSSESDMGGDVNKSRSSAVHYPEDVWDLEFSKKEEEAFRTAMGFIQLAEYASRSLVGPATDEGRSVKLMAFKFGVFDYLSQAIGTGSDGCVRLATMYFAVMKYINKKSGSAKSKAEVQELGARLGRQKAGAHSWEEGGKAVDRWIRGEEGAPFALARHLFETED